MSEENITTLYRKRADFLYSENASDNEIALRKMLLLLCDRYDEQNESSNKLEHIENLSQREAKELIKSSIENFGCFLIDRYENQTLTEEKIRQIVSEFLSSKYNQALAEPALNQNSSGIQPTELDIPTELWERFVAIKDPDVSNIVDDVRNYIERLEADLKDLQSQRPPCSHTCYHHQTHPCEKCGRINGYLPAIWAKYQQAERIEQLEKIIEQLEIVWLKYTACVSKYRTVKKRSFSMSLSDSNTARNVEKN